MKYLIKRSFCLFFLCVAAQLAIARGVAMYTMGFVATGSAAAHVGDFRSPSPSISGLTEGSATSKANLAIDGVTVERSGGFLQAQTVSTERLGDSTAKGRDYTEVNDFAIPLMPGGFASATNTSLLGLNDNGIFEGSGAISVEGVLADSTVTPAAMKNADFTLTLSQSSANEDDGNVNLVVTITADAPHRENIIMYLGIYGRRLPSSRGLLRAAESGSDYTFGLPGPGQIKAFVRHTTQLDFSLALTIIDDHVPEGDETITIIIALDPEYTNIILAEDFTITDNEETPSTPLVLTFSQSSANEDDGNVNLVATVTADAPPGENTAMYLSTLGPLTGRDRLPGTAERGSDYTVSTRREARAGVLEANSTQLNLPLGLTIVDDHVPEGDETITILIALDPSFTNIILAEDFTITDDDAFTLTLSPDSANEDDGNVNLVATVTADAPPGENITMYLGISNCGVTIVRPFHCTVPRIPRPRRGISRDMARHGSDYTVNETISIQAGVLGVNLTQLDLLLGLTIIDDNITEGDETITIIIALDPEYTNIILAEDFTITDDDPLPTSIALSVSPSSVAEGATATSVTVTATVEGSTRFPGFATLWGLTVGDAGDSAVEGTDYAVVANTSGIIIPAGAASAATTFSLAPIQDVLFEGTETISVAASHSNPDVTVTPTEITITDDESPSTALVLTLDPARLHEDSGTSWVRFTAGLDGATSTMDTPVEVRVTAGTATEDTDYRASMVPTSLMISSGETNLSDSLQVTVINDDAAEGDETIIIEVSSMGLTPTTQNLVIIDDEHTVRIDTLMVDANDSDYTITASVRQNMGAPVTSVVLYYGDGMTFEMTPMEMSPEGSYTADLMAPAEDGILYYYVEATNGDGLTATYPPDRRYWDVSDYAEGSRLVFLDFEEDASDQSAARHYVAYKGGAGVFEEGALVLDGVDDHAEILGSSLGASEEFALEIMFNADDFDAAVLDAGGTYLVSKPARCAACWEESTFSLLWERSADSGTLLAARFWNPEYGESGQVELEIPMPLIAGQWYHAVLEVQRRDAGQRALLRLRDQSGMLHGEDVAVLPAHPAISVYPIFVGHIGDRGFFDGRIDDVAFYNYTRFDLSLTNVGDTWEVPEGYVLEQNYPNPFNPVTTIRYDLARVGHVSLEVSDLLGRRVAMLVDAVQEAGAQEIRFDARDLPSGMYLYRLRVEDFVSVKKMVLLK